MMSCALFHVINKVKNRGMHHSLALSLLSPSVNNGTMHCCRTISLDPGLNIVKGSTMTLILLLDD